ncbi:MAG: SH3 domain-containing protein [Desulfobacterales bacterium]
MKKILLFAIILVILLTTGTVLAERLSISVPKANIRSGPGTQYDVLWNCEKYYPFIVLKKNGDWYRFKDFENDEGWIHKSIVDNTRSVITKNDKSNVRSGPATRFNIVFTVEKGVPFKVIEKKGQWLHIQHADGDQGWIYEPLVW